MDSVEILKGTRYYNTEEQILREKIIETIKEVLERYGFNPIETPILQFYSLLSSKYAGGEEILEECYRLKDRGNRELGLRYELTITLVPFFLQNQNIKLPFKRYEIGKVFRDGPVKKARTREFTQFDFDIIGCKSKLAELEVLSIYNEVFEKLGIEIEIKLNNRKILLGILEYANIKENQDSIILTIDKLEKIGGKGVRAELVEKGLKEEQVDKIFQVINLEGSNEEILGKLKKFLKTKNGEEGIKEIEEILKLADSYKLDIKFSPSLARGLNYYTSTIYEVFSKKGEIKSSLGAGGRYDNLLKNFLGKELPAIGGSFGVDAIASILKPEKKSKIQAYLIPIGISEEKFFPILKELRKNLNTDFDLIGRGISKNLEFADRNKIPFCVIVGEDELKQKKVRLKNMNTREEKILEVKEAIKEIKQLTNNK
jgi:histidyl-tRNA synthetase